MFIQIHTLRDYSTALPNRGQDGLAKRTIYGGYRAAADFLPELQGSHAR